MTKFFFIQLCFLTVSWGVSAQVPQVDIPVASWNELQKFSSRGQALPLDYVERVPGLVHHRVLADLEIFVKSLHGTCREVIRVTFGARLTDEKDAAIVDFEEGLVKIEASKCFSSTVDPKFLIAITSQMSFKKEVFPTLERITEQGNENCEWTDAPTVGRSHYCYANQMVENTKDAQTLVSFLTFNDASYEAPVYLRETLVSARRVGAAILFFSESYVRANKFSAFKSFFAKGYIQNSQSTFFQVLENYLHTKGTK